MMSQRAGKDGWRAAADFEPFPSETGDAADDER